MSSREPSRDTLNSVIKEEVIDLSDIGLTEEAIKGVGRIYIVACGSAYHVGMAAQYVLEDMAGIPVRVELASEFRYRSLLLEPDSLVMIVSQSGETADSLAALREAKKRGVKTLGIVNVVGSSIAREADSCILYVSRTGDRRSDDKGVQHTADRDCICSRYSSQRVRGSDRRRGICAELYPRSFADAAGED